MFPKKSRSSILGLAALLAAVSAAGTFSTYRFIQAGRWLPPVPETVNLWEAAVSPIDPVVLSMLGNPRAVGRTYRHPLGDTVEFSLVTAGMFENYHDPTVCVGGGDFRMTAVRNVALASDSGAGKARAMVFRHRQQENVRIVMYYWQQNRDGSTDTEARMGNFRDIVARFKTGFGSVVQGHQTVLVRIFTYFDDRRDPDGRHAQSTVHEISQAVYQHLRQEGSRR